jgi:hypothetical protein
MSGKSQFPTREELDQAFHFLQDQITRISVSEEEEMEMKETNGKDDCC